MPENKLRSKLSSSENTGNSKFSFINCRKLVQCQGELLYRERMCSDVRLRKKARKSCLKARIHKDHKVRQPPIIGLAEPLWSYNWCNFQSRHNCNYHNDND